MFNALIDTVRQAHELACSIANPSLRISTKSKLDSVLNVLLVAEKADAPALPLVDRERKLRIKLATWDELHTKLDVDAAWDEDFNRRVCSSCLPKWLQIVADNPPVYGPGRFAWTVKVHNLVNESIGKPALTEADAAIRWAVVQG